ncbi:MAG: hypothetical protein PUB67_05970 [Clostridiales bacterium]|nr:hypothetical protein [Clostridiales bacterium]
MDGSQLHMSIQEADNISLKQQFLDFIAHQGIRTKKYIGTIVFRGEQLNIYPKMFRPWDM